jgi:hypothetical protein
MAYLTLTEFEDLMQSIFCSILEWESEELKNNVRISWPEEGQPAWEITEDLVFLRCYEINDSINKEREHTDEYQVSPDEFARDTKYSIVMAVDVILYGPNSFENARNIRDGIFSENIKLILKQNDIYLKPKEDQITPKRADEYFEGRWWRRTDIGFRFNEKMVVSTTIPAIDSVNIGIYEGEEGSKIAEVNVNNE